MQLAVLHRAAVTVSSVTGAPVNGKHAANSSPSEEMNTALFTLQCRAIASFNSEENHSL
jgi:hypothetical protein